ncbi:hypothetical protein AURDEDRAFT_158595 [Auricularia subglabra TFB-10046 SS5]|nr:hypothetical protein AURDEDRAFT_158595 [Auricularia subglabra TFB-10046 SS5]
MDEYDYGSLTELLLPGEGARSSDSRSEPLEGPCQFSVLVCEALSWCKTPEENLMVAYNSLETSMNLADPDLVHRDLSRFNILCRPRHDRDFCPNMPTLKRRSIASFLGDGDGTRPLAAGVYHCAVPPTFLARNSARRKETMGTPMYKALELTCPPDLTRSSYNDAYLNLEPLVEDFETIDERKYRNILLRAFPGDKPNFFDEFQAIASDEKARRKAVERGESPAFVVPDMHHAPRHDAESFYWVLLWALGRALPKGAPDQRTGAFDSYCQDMLNESIFASTGNSTGNRKGYIAPSALLGLLHSRLTSYKPLQQQMAIHFSIPWDLYKTRLPDDHAHIALRRLLLLAFVCGDKNALALPLDTSQHRRCMFPTGDRNHCEAWGHDSDTYSYDARSIAGCSANRTRAGFIMDLAVIHRDFNWFYIRCKPRHDPNPSPHVPALKRRCSPSILGEGDEPSADRGVVFSRLTAGDGASGKEKTGTPVFMSLELSNPAGLNARYNSDGVNFPKLVRAFEAIEMPRYRGALLRAFPGDELTFARDIKIIVEKEVRRRTAVDEGDEEEYNVPDLPHALRHDADSMYWVLLWALGAALPRGAPDQAKESFDVFIEEMLSPGRSYRQAYLVQGMLENLLHPQLKYFEGALLHCLAAYFSIPWALYEK